MAAVAILANGNDYLPGVLNTSLESNATGKGLWDVYLALRLLPKWQDRLSATLSGARNGISFRAITSHEKAQHDRLYGSLLCHCLASGNYP